MVNVVKLRRKASAVLNTRKADNNNRIKPKSLESMENNIGSAIQLNALNTSTEWWPGMSKYVLPAGGHAKHNSSISTNEEVNYSTLPNRSYYNRRGRSNSPSSSNSGSSNNSKLTNAMIEEPIIVTQPYSVMAHSKMKTLERITSMIMPRRNRSETKNNLAVNSSSLMTQTTDKQCIRRYPRFGAFLRKLAHLHRPSFTPRKVAAVTTTAANNFIAPSTRFYDPIRLADPLPSRQFFIDPRQLQFSLPCIPDSFADGPRLDNLVRAIRTNRLSITALMPLRVRRDTTGQLYAIDCRRLYVLRKANIALATAIEIPHVMTEEEVERAGGDSIRLMCTYNDTDTSSSTITANPSSCPVDHVKEEIFQLIAEITAMPTLVQNT
ncbi:hypothetical protein BDF19DRAFT_433297 [Syncephalis fuscata]|nr:hypothetical protein BDF19DRAFT_433297 [Syncephalis fuscata]